MTVHGDLCEAIAIAVQRAYELGREVGSEAAAPDPTPLVATMIELQVELAGYTSVVRRESELPYEVARRISGAVTGLALMAFKTNNPAVLAQAVRYSVLDGMADPREAQRLAEQSLRERERVIGDLADWAQYLERPW